MAGVRQQLFIGDQTMQGGTTAERGLVRAYVRVCGQKSRSHAIYSIMITSFHVIHCSTHVQQAGRTDRCVDGGADWANLIEFTASFAQPTATAMASSAVDSGGLPISSETEFPYTIPTVNQVKSCVLRVGDC
jgi:hypothetical protein